MVDSKKKIHQFTLKDLDLYFYEYSKSCNAVKLYRMRKFILTFSKKISKNVYQLDLSLFKKIFGV